MTEVPEIRRYVRRATAAIPASGERADAAAELYEHVLTRFEEAQAEGSTTRRPLPPRAVSSASRRTLPATSAKPITNL